MKHYFLVAKDVGDLTNIFCAALEEHNAKATPGLNRFFRLPGRRRHRTIPGSTDFVVENDRINTANAKVFARDPVNLIRIFHLADRYDLAFHPDAMQKRPLAQPDRRKPAVRTPRPTGCSSRFCPRGSSRRVLAAW